MGWSGGESEGKPLLWAVHEAELTYHVEESRIGWAQVGLDVGSGITEIGDRSTLDEGPPAGVDLSSADWAAYPMPDAGPATDPAVAIPPLIQCVDDSLRWFGETELSALQVTGFNVSRTKRPYEFDSIDALSWFRAPSSALNIPAVVTFAADRWDDRMAAAVADEVRQWNTGSFEFGSLVPVPGDYISRPEWMGVGWATDASNLGIPVSMAEWSASSIGWIIARAFDLTLSLDAAPANVAVRVTRLDEPL